MKDDNRQLKFRDVHKDSKAQKAFIESNRFPLALLCDSFSKAANIGMMLRLAEAARLQEVILWNNKLDLSSKKYNGYLVITWKMFLFDLSRATIRRKNYPKPID